jgi:hypothetical protein
MSIEALLTAHTEALIANTAAVRDLIAGLTKSGLLTHGQVTVPAATPAAATEPEKPKETKTETAALTVQDCINLVPNLVAKKGRDSVVALCAEFNVPKASALKPEQAAAFHAKATALLNAA